MFVTSSETTGRLLLLMQRYVSSCSEWVSLHLQVLIHLMKLELCAYGPVLLCTVWFC